MRVDRGISSILVHSGGSGPVVLSPSVTRVGTDSLLGFNDPDLMAQIEDWSSL
jgi:hypothetical protein